MNYYLHLFLFICCSITIECGRPVQVLGDAFIARNFDNEDSFKRLDFTLDEYRNDKKWKEDAREANKNSSEDQAEAKKVIKHSGIDRVSSHTIGSMMY